MMCMSAHYVGGTSRMGYCFWYGSRHSLNSHLNRWTEYSTTSIDTYLKQPKGIVLFYDLDLHGH